MITVTEKEHWKQRIARRISQAIAELVDREDPGYLTRVQHDARQAAMKHLGIAELLTREKSLEDQERKLHQEKQELHWQIVAAIRKVTPEEVRAHYCNAPAEWERAVRERQEAEERRLMAASPLGAVILKLKREEEELLDTVWLATSPKQIKSLWQGVAELVSAEPTALQRQALQDDGATDA
jgi:hypothetical protein